MEQIQSLYPKNQVMLLSLIHILPELNYGQLVHEVERAANGMAKVKLLAKYNTEIFTPDEVTSAIEKLAQEVLK